MTNTENMSVAEAAECLRVSRPFIHKLIKQGKLRAYKLGRRTIVKARDLDRALEEAR